MTQAVHAAAPAVPASSAPAAPTALHPACQAQRHDGMAAIRTLQASWQALADVRSENSPFAGPGFVLAALEAYHRQAQPVLHAVGRPGALEAVLPLIRRPLRRWGAPVNQLMSPHNPQFILNDPLLCRADAGTALDAATGLLRSLLAERWDSLVLQHLPPEAARCLQAAAQQLGLGGDGLEPSRSLHVAVIEGSYADYLATRSRDHRWQIKKFTRRAAEAGGWHVEKRSTAAAIEAAFPAWFEIERQSWQGATPAAAMTDADRYFMQRLLRELPPEERGELWLLHMAGEPAAALRMLGGRRRTCVHTMHFAQRFKEFAPGTLLLAAMLEDACARGLAEVDFHGHGAHFKRWATEQRPLFSLRLYRPGVRGALFRGARRLYRRWAEVRAPALVAE